MMAAPGPDVTLEQPTAPALFSEVVFHIVESQTLPHETAREVCISDFLF